MKAYRIILLIVALSGLMSLSSCEKAQVKKQALSCQQGIVKDYTGLDGCGLLIVLDDSTVLEPVILPDGVSLAAGQRVCVSYAEKDFGSYCMAGRTVEITSLVLLQPMTIIEAPFTTDQNTYPDDPVGLEDAYIQGDELFLEVGYAGGCEKHEFYAVRHLPWCATPPVPVDVRLYHDGNGDLCEAYIRETLEIDLKYLQSFGSSPVTFNLYVNEGDSLIQRTLSYNF